MFEHGRHKYPCLAVGISNEGLDEYLTFRKITYVGCLMEVPLNFQVFNNNSQKMLSD